jgi:cell division protein FtsB
MMAKNKRKALKPQTASGQDLMAHRAPDGTYLWIVSIFITIIIFMLTTIVRHVAILQEQAKQQRKAVERLANDNHKLQQAVDDMKSRIVGHQQVFPVKQSDTGQ